jgi:integral membrane sensor domain MASE1
MAYLALGAFSAFFAYSNQDAWGVWLASGFALGLLFARARSDWMPVLAGAFLGAIIFEPLVGSSLVETLGFALIEVIVTLAGGTVAALLSPTPIRFVAPRDFGATIAGAFVLALTGAVIIGLWEHFAGRPDAWSTSRVWLVGNFVAMLFVAPFVASWAQLRLERLDARTLTSFAGGAVACALFLVCVYALFTAVPEGPIPHTFAVGLIYLPFVLMVIVALLWGARGATLAAMACALIAITQTVRGLGPFVGQDGLFGDSVLTAQVYAVALSITGLLVATMVHGRRVAAAQARE